MKTRFASILTSVLLPLWLSAPETVMAQTVEQRVNEAVNRLRQGLEAGELGGRFVQRMPGSYDFVPTRRALPIASVANPAQVGTLAAGPEVLVKGTLDETGRKLTIQSYRLAASAGQAVPVPAAASPPVRDAFAASNAIVGRLNEAARPGAQSVESRVLSRATPLGKSTMDDVSKIVESYDTARASGDQAALDAILTRWSELRSTIAAVFSDGSQYKAIYGFQDNYPPWRYQRVHRDAASVVAIGEPGRNTSRCSGVLIAQDLVLTAGHCFSSGVPMSPDQLEVWFGYQQLENGSFPAPERRKIVAAVAPAQARWPKLMQGQYGRDLLDYAIVRFETPNPSIPNDAQPQCLRRSPMRRSEGVYVVGYPEGKPVTVHDAGRVTFPFSILEGDQFKLLRLDVETDFKNSAERADVMSEFDASYNEVSGGVLPSRYFYDIRDGGQPRMGITVDTFAGNSGGPVYDHDRNQCVVGILNRGMADIGAPYVPNWRQHERALPMSAILEDLEKDPVTAPLVSGGKLTVKP